MLYYNSRLTRDGDELVKKSVLKDKLIKMTGKSAEEIEPLITHIYVQLFGVSGNGGKFGEAHIPREFSDYFLENSPVAQKQGDIYRTLTRYVETFKRYYNPKEGDKPICNIYLWSNEKGNGKSTTAAALLNEFMIMGWKASVSLSRSWDKPPAFFLDVNELQALYNKFTRNGIAQEIAEEASREYYRLIDKATVAPLVVFDDIGVRSATEAFRGDIHTIINKRMVDGLTSIYTSNFPLKYMAELFDERIYDRIHANCIDINFKGQSMRGVNAK